MQAWIFDRLVRTDPFYLIAGSYATWAGIQALAAFTLPPLAIVLVNLVSMAALIGFFGFLAFLDENGRFRDEN